MLFYASLKNSKECSKKEMIFLQYLIFDFLPLKNNMNISWNYPLYFDISLNVPQ